MVNTNNFGGTGITCSMFPIYGTALLIASGNDNKFQKPRRKPSEAAMIGEVAILSGTSNVIW